jgi:Zn-dependent peptidase ImmA (M78 family)/transcriptional regulator with XRE-family HTH domain
LIGERLKTARTGRGWTLEALSGHTGIPVSSLSEFENGRREPRLTHLEALAKAYGTTVAWFFESQPAEGEVVLWRERPSGDGEAAVIEGQFLRLCRWYRNLEEWCDERRPCNLPEFSGDPNGVSRADVHRLASDVRHMLDLGRQPAASLLSVLENSCGIRIFHLQFEPTGTAACTRSNQLGMAILLNAGNKRWRRNFDLAHELFHLLTWRVFRSDEGSREASEQEEKLANAFASSLLVPEDALRNAVAAATKSGGSLKHIEIFDIARQFDVSFEALLWRMHTVFNRQREDTDRDIEVCRAFRDSVDVREDTDPPQLPTRYRALAIRALRQGELSVGRAAEYLGISRHTAMALDDLEDVTDDAIALDSA